MKLNINQQVKVKLNEKGKELLFNHYDEFVLQLDQDGYYKIQLWKLMQVFGNHLHMGKELPFEAEIEVVEDSL
ncbi:hypothetical protein EVU96_09060 [Bacillus infantis]|uniref:hypothetical protein n=1 Tax=Bacillus infantis TaxID=324767 RepID=UPI00101D6A2F|nr:hypothetical protein [Bacillus infantis]RYI30554.1 hypothetical protein EVU96_09060 [Bacillus infantis]